MRWLTLIALMICLSGCDEEPAGEDCLGDVGIAPACGVAVDGGAVLLGDTRADVEVLLGQAPSVLDLGDLGVRFTYVDPPLSGVYGSDDTVTSIALAAGFGGTTAGGNGLESAESGVCGEFGEPDADPVLGLWWYADQGIAWRLEEGGATGIEVFEAR